MSMLNVQTVTKRALRWSIIAELAVIDGDNATTCFAKASAYMDVLNINWHGKGDTRDNLQGFAKVFAECYVLDRDCNGDCRAIGQYMDECLNIEKYKT